MGGSSEIMYDTVDLGAESIIRFGQGFSCCKLKGHHFVIKVVLSRKQYLYTACAL